jgi:hypothetical protein
MKKAPSTLPQNNYSAGARETKTKNSFGKGDRFSFGKGDRFIFLVSLPAYFPPDITRTVAMAVPNKSQ